MSIAVYGGCFNPPHLGHRAAAQCAWESLRPDRLLILPDREPPHKQQVRGEPAALERLELCRLGFQGLEGVEVSDSLLRLPGPSRASQLPYHRRTVSRPVPVVSEDRGDFPEV